MSLLSKEKRIHLPSILIRAFWLFTSIVLIQLLISQSYALNESSKYVNPDTLINTSQKRTTLIQIIFSAISLILHLASALLPSKCTSISSLEILALVSVFITHLSFFSNTIHKLNPAETTNPTEICLSNYQYFLPEGSLEFYEQASKLICSEECPCDDDKTSYSETLAQCLFKNTQVTTTSTDESSLNISEQNKEFFSFWESLHQIEENMHCSGICTSNNLFLFSDQSKGDEDSIDNDKSCYESAVEQAIKSANQVNPITALSVAALVLMIMQVALLSDQLSNSLQLSYEAKFIRLTLPTSSISSQVEGNMQQTAAAESNIQQKEKIVAIELFEKKVNPPRTPPSAAQLSVTESTRPTSNVSIVLESPQQNNINNVLIQQK